MTNPDRVVVFMDYQNLHGWARRQFFAHGADPAEGHVDPLQLARHLCDRRKRASALEQVRVYRGRPNPDKQPGATRANDRQTAAWQRSPLVHVVRRNLTYPHDWPTSAAVEKGIDVAVATDMIHLAMAGALDVAILFSSDKDLLPAVELLMEHRLCHVEVAAWERANRLHLGHNSKLPWCHNANESTYRTLQDTVDYSAARQPFPAALRPKLPPRT